MHKNLKHAVIKHLGKKKYSQFSDSYYNNNKHFLRFHIKQYWPFQGGNTRLYYTLFEGSYQTILRLSGSHCQIKVNTFSEFISNITDTFRELLQNITTLFSRHQTVLTFPKSYWQTILYTFLELTSSNTGIFKELLTNNTIHFSRVYIKQYWHFQRVTSKLNYNKSFFQISYHKILTLSKSYCQTMLT